MNEGRPGLGLIGYGHWGPNVARTLATMPGCRLLSICDTDVDSRSAARQRFPKLQIFDDSADQFADEKLDAILICTPAASHYELAKRALAARKHVFVEKTMTLSSAEGEELVRMAREAGRLLMPGYIFRYNSAVQAIRRMIDEGELGRVNFMTSVRSNPGPVRTDVSVLWDLAPHDISFLSHWFGAWPCAVYATGRSFGGERATDTAFLDLEYAQGRVSHTTVSWLSPRKDRTVTIVGSRGMVVWDDVNVSEPLRIYRHTEESAAHGSSDDLLQFKATPFEREILIPKIPMDSPLRRELEDFVDGIVTGKKPVSTANDAVAVTTVLEAADASLRSGARVEVKAGP